MRRRLTLFDHAPNIASIGRCAARDAALRHCSFGLDAFRVDQPRPVLDFVFKFAV
jgi:hypothetical protein